MSPIMSSSQGAVLATAMAAAAVSAGTVILLAISHQKLFSPATHFFPDQIAAVPRSCISSDGKKKRKSKKRVKFAKDVVEPSGNNQEFRKRRNMIVITNSCTTEKISDDDDANKNRGIPENRMALYNGMLRGRVDHRLAYSC